MGTFLTSSWLDFEKFFGIGGHTSVDTSGMQTQGQVDTATNAQTLKNAGTLTAIFGGINSAIGSYYQAQAQQYQLKSQASSLQFQSGMDAINAHGAEMSAQSIEEAGKTQVEQYTMKAGQEAAATQVGTAARGVDLSSGSAVAQRASDELVKQLDVLTINSNATRAAWSQRTQATNDQNQSLLAGVSASNLRAGANTISPGLAVSTSLLNSATGIASQWDYRRKIALATGFAPPPSYPGFASGMGQ